VYVRESYPPRSSPSLVLVTRLGATGNEDEDGDEDEELGPDFGPRCAFMAGIDLWGDCAEAGGEEGVGVGGGIAGGPGSQDPWGDREGVPA